MDSNKMSVFTKCNITLVTYQYHNLIIKIIHSNVKLIQKNIVLLNKILKAYSAVSTNF